MPGKENIINREGVAIGLPVYTPSGPVDLGGGASRVLSFDEAFQNKLDDYKETGGVAAIPGSSFYTGERFNSSKPFTDTEEMAAQQQSSWAKWGNGFGKMLGTASTTFVGGTVGTIVGLVNLIGTQKFSSFYDNDFSRVLDDINKRMEDALPNYYTQAEKNAEWYSPENILTANFWSDKVIKNLGFSIGTLAGGVAWGAALKI